MSERFDDGKARGEIHDKIMSEPITMTVMVDLMMSAYARGRREAIEAAVRYLIDSGHGFASTTYRLAAASIERHEAELNAKGSDHGR